MVIRLLSPCSCYTTLHTSSSTSCLPSLLTILSLYCSLPLTSSTCLRTPFRMTKTSSSSASPVFFGFRFHSLFRDLYHNISSASNRTPYTIIAEHRNVNRLLLPYECDYISPCTHSHSSLCCVQKGMSLDYLLFIMQVCMSSIIHIL